MATSRVFCCPPDACRSVHAAGCVVDRLRKSAQIGLCNAKIGHRAKNIFGVPNALAQTAPDVVRSTRIVLSQTACTNARKKKH